MYSSYTRKIVLYATVLGACVVGFIFYRYGLATNELDTLSPPTLRHWFGTDPVGSDILLESIIALLIATLTVMVILGSIYIGGIAVGTILSYFDSAALREFFLNLVHYWITLPILLIAIFLLILVGAGQVNVIGILIFVLLPSHALYVYNQMNEAKKQDFAIAKRSYGFSKGYVFLHHLFPYTKNSLNKYTVSRMPEILIMDLAFNFLGLGTQPPNSSFGRLLADGLPFMFSAWWVWVFPSLLLVLLFLLANCLVSIFASNKNF